VRRERRARNPFDHACVVHARGTNARGPSTSR
jgi:hypothetical protein